MRNNRTTRIALIATMAVYLYAIVTFVSLSASGVFYKEVPLISTPLPTSIPTPLTPTPTPTALTLISPEDNEILDNGRTDFMDYMVWDFDWSDVEGATRYHLFVINPLGFPYINYDYITSSSYHLESRGYQTSDGLEGWTWGVRAFVNGQWNEWSDTRHFDVEPPNTDLAWDTATSLTPTPTPIPTPTTAWTGRLDPVNRVMEDTFGLFGSGIFPFVFPFIGLYMLLLLTPGPFP